MNDEQKLIAEIDNFIYINEDIEKHVDQLEKWRTNLTQSLKVRPVRKSLRDESALADQVKNVHDKVHGCMEDWNAKWDNSKAAEKLSDDFGDRAILLVFGKVNAGKSSFCNLLAERFRAQGKTVQYFKLESNEIRNMQNPFKEGVTETTTDIQGVFLGEKLALLDTPGLHSVTEANQEMTKRFTNSADAVLWLTSSSSPGQVQELDALIDELKSGKPLLPVITKSDEFDEDEIDNRIVKELRNKTAENRKIQEEDVKKRAIQKLKDKGSLLRDPVSVSAHYVKEIQKPQSFEEAGFNTLYSKLTEIIKDARCYKQRKAGEIMLNHLKTIVLRSLREKILPELNRVKQLALDANNKLERDRHRIESDVVRAVASALPSILEQHRTTRDVKAVYGQLNTLVLKGLEDSIHETLKDYVTALDSLVARLSPNENVGYEDVAIEFEIRRGATKRAAAGAAGAAAGAFLGSFIPGVGTVIGAVIGSVVGGIGGSKIGEYLEETKMERRVVGVSYEQLQVTVENDIRKHIHKLVKDVIAQCKETIHLVAEDAERVKLMVSDAERQLVELEEGFHHDAV
jgi:ribosome biogenesis GTPase A/uncharacterized protein YcfJ